MTNEKRPGDETNRSDGTEGNDAEGIKQEMFTAWKVEHPDGTLQHFDDEWAAMTSAKRPSEPESRGPVRWDEGPEALKMKFFEEWKADRPHGTMAQFEVEWAAVTAASGV